MSESDNRRYYLRNGNCPYCTGRNKVLPGLTYCEECREKVLSRINRKQMRYREEGRCIVCGAPSEPGCTKCRKHLDMATANARKRYHERRDQGLCVKCGKVVAEPPGCTCKACGRKNKRYRTPELLNTWYDNKQRKRQERIASGLCVDCGSPAVDGHVRCQACLDRRSDYARVRRIQKRLDKEAQEARERGKANAV